MCPAKPILSNLKVLAFILLMIIVGADFSPMLATALSMDKDLLTLILLGTGVFSLVIAFLTANNRYLRKKIIPKLSQALKPLQTTQAELETILAELKAAKLGIVSYFFRKRFIKRLINHINAQ